MPGTRTDLPWKEAIITVLEQAGSALHYTEIAQQVAEQKLRRHAGEYRRDDDQRGDERKQAPKSFP